METLALYAVKVILISVLFYGYYYFILRNKSFHYYNRFYLLAAIILSIVLPVVPFEALFPGTGNVPEVVRYDYVGQIIAIPETAAGSWNHDALLMLVYSGVSAGLMVLFLFSLWRLVLIRERGIKKSFKDFTLVKTHSGGTPYSFFRNIFWDPGIDTDSEKGVGMLRHELVHVRQHHSTDKLAMNLVQILFWFNPAFWMMKRELSMIHEFLADKEAFGERGAADFSKMALSAAYPGYTWPAKNNFFHKPIKRRLIMLLKNNQQKATYWGRVSALPLVVLIAVFFSFKANAEKEGMAVNKDPQKVNSIAILDTVPERKDLRKVELHPANNKTAVIVERNNGRKDSVSAEKAKESGVPLPPPPPPGIASTPYVAINDNDDGHDMKGKGGYITFTRDNGQKDSLSMKEAKRLGILPPPPPPPPPAPSSSTITVSGYKRATEDSAANTIPGKGDGHQPLYILEGKEISAAEMNGISPDAIQSIHVLKDQSAVNVYGEKGRNGVIEIELKK